MASTFAGSWAQQQQFNSALIMMLSTTCTFLTEAMARYIGKNKFRTILVMRPKTPARRARLLGRISSQACLPGWSRTVVRDCKIRRQIARQPRQERQKSGPSSHRFQVSHSFRTKSTRFQQKTPRRMGKAKAKTILIRLMSNAGTGYFYVKRKNPKNTPFKLELMKYDPVVNKHVLFSEQKFKK